MINILFVDDEPNILDGLQRMLRSVRHEWQMSFANNGAEALNFMAQNNVDVIVSDMKMPGMDGSQLLQEVRKLYPQVVRIILSGYSEKDMILKSVGAAHQYLAKPCDAENLKATVQRACALRNLLGDEKLRRLVSQMHHVPSLPHIYQELVSELNRDDPSIKRIAEIVKTDIGMTAKILQMVNSAFFGLRRQISNANEAVNFLGLETISSLTLGIGVFSQFETDLKSLNLLTNLWRHSVSVGVMASLIANIERREVAHDAFTAGLLHDIGEIVLAVNLPEQFVLAQELVIRKEMSLSEAEKQIFEATHAEIGAYLLGLWGLPNSVVEAVAFHHIPGQYQTETFTALTAVHIANAIQRVGYQLNTELPPCFYDVEYLTRLNMLEKLPFLHQNCLTLSKNLD
jgi:HD-like signal output (HDOD) protein